LKLGESSLLAGIGSPRSRSRPVFSFVSLPPSLSYHPRFPILRDNPLADFVCTSLPSLLPSQPASHLSSTITTTTLIKLLPTLQTRPSRTTPANSLPQLTPFTPPPPRLLLPSLLPTTLLSPLKEE